MCKANPFKTIFLNWLQNIQDYKVEFTEHINDKDYIVVSCNDPKYTKRTLVIAANNRDEQTQINQLIAEINKVYI